jgi:hypothetical protein
MHIRYIDMVVGYDEAKELCQLAGGYLATIKSPRDAEIVRQLMALTTGLNNYDAPPEVAIQSLAYIGGYSLNQDEVYRWQDDTNDVIGFPNYDAWAPGTPGRGGGRICTAAAINSQKSKVYVIDYYCGYTDYQIGAICQLPKNGGSNQSWPLLEGKWMLLNTHGLILIIGVHDMSVVYTVSSSLHSDCQTQRLTRAKKL